MAKLGRELRCKASVFAQRRSQTLERGCQTREGETASRERAKERPRDQIRALALCRGRAALLTGLSRHRYNDSLLEEGKMMRRLQHSRVVRLLGVIIQEGDYSLVMEYMEKGSLMHVLRAQVGPAPAPQGPAPQ